jgi:HprK-related kinase A
MWSINTGLYTYRLTGLPSSLLPALENLYPESINKALTVADFQIDITQTSLLRTLLRPQVSIKIDGHQPFNPISPKKLLPSIEWAMNWCIAAYDHTHLLIHCSVVEKNGKVILFPAKSGSGKSTTSSYLALNGWHLFYDEMAVIELSTGKVQPVYRPTSLKNNSVDIIKPYFNQQHRAYLSDTVEGTHKGAIAHLRPHDRATFNTFVPAVPTAVVFLNYEPETKFEFYEVDQSIGFSKLTVNAFNYPVIGEAAFHTLINMVGNAGIYEATYSNLPELAAFLEEIVDE